MSHNHDHHGHHHDHSATEKTIKYLCIAFGINMLLSLVEIAGGIAANSVSLIADALHNTGDAMSMLIAIMAYKISRTGANDNYTYGFGKAESVGSLVNASVLFVSGIYLFFEGIGRIFNPESINGTIIIVISILALIIDLATVKISHGSSKENTNIKLVFIHNLADAMGSIGVIISGIFIIYFGWKFVDGIIAMLIAAYMIIQSVLIFPKISKILMNAVPENMDRNEIKKELLKIKGIKDIHHIHIWNISEKMSSIELHVVVDNFCNDVILDIKKKLKDKFNIEHSTIQMENKSCGCKECLG